MSASPPAHAKPRWQVIVALIGAAGIITAAYLGSREASQSGTPAAKDPPARVLLLIDVSRSMECPLVLKKDPSGDPNKVEVCDDALIEREQRLRKPRRTRIEAVRDLVGPRLETLDQDDDRIGLWLFTTSDEGLPDECDAEGLPCKLRALGYASPEVRARLKMQIGTLPTNYGGTPLYKAIALGVDELRHDRGPANAVNSLVVITDGFDNTDDGDNRSRSELMDIADEPGASVQVLMTAAGQQICDVELKPAVRDLFGGTCEDAETDTELDEAGDNIVGALRDPPGPDSPRSLAR